MSGIKEIKLTVLVCCELLLIYLFYGMYSAKFILSDFDSQCHIYSNAARGEKSFIFFFFGSSHSITHFKTNRENVESLLRADPKILYRGTQFI